MNCGLGSQSIQVIIALKKWLYSLIIILGPNQSSKLLHVSFVSGVYFSSKESDMPKQTQ